ncbi:hypothetical protein J6TS7_00110 [Paenibacillus dendritiformis]|nr:hypothetical protein J6TS7_00110 [Paenibacillus dendritiformis]
MFSGRRGEQASSPGWGGDEFAVLCPADAEHDPAAMAMRMIEQIRLPYQLNQTGFFVTTSIGIAIYSEYGLTASELLRNADKAMYEVKKDGKNACQFYSAAFDAHLQEKIELENDLRKAVARQELVVHYQPQNTLKENQLIGVEALVRWNHPRKGLLDPSVFIPIAEETGMIYEMGAWILRKPAARCGPGMMPAGRKSACRSIFRPSNSICPIYARRFAAFWKRPVCRRNIWSWRLRRA